MALDLTPEQKATGRQNFEQAAGELARDGKMPSMVVGGTDPKHPDRRDFLKAGLAVGAVVPVGHVTRHPEARAVPSLDRQGHRSGPTPPFQRR